MTHTARAPGPNRRRVAPVLAALLLLAVGVGFLCYPPMNRAYHAWRSRKTNNVFAGQVEQLTQTEKDILYERMLQYNRELYQNGQSGLSDAFAYEQADFSLAEYGLASVTVGYLTVPGLCAGLPVYLGAGRENLARGGAQLAHTSLPVGGDNSNTVIAAHRDLSGGDMFRDIDKLQTGDMVYLANFRETLAYQVVETAIIRPDEIERILIQPGRDLVTLITCNPYGYNYERYVVYAERVI